MNLGTWKITIGGASFAGYSDVLQPEGVTGGPDIKWFPAYGASAPIPVVCGNTKLVRKFTLTRTHATDTLAHAWYQTAAANWAGVATVVLTHMDYAGVETAFTIANSEIQIEVATPIGLTTITKLTFTGGPAT